MIKVWRYDRGYNIALKYVNFCTRATFSRIRVTGKENIPTDGHIMFAPNHCSCLMDPLVMLVTKRGPVAFGARYDIFKNPKIAKILNWLRILPIARERDGLKNVTSNYETFDQIVECLSHGVPFCLYSEGRHRPERGMLPVRKGIFRVCKKAMDELDGPIYIVPVGVDYQYFFRQGGTVDVRIGKPMEMSHYMIKGEHPEGEAAIYREMCDELQHRILSLIGQVPERRTGLAFLRSLLALALSPLTLAMAAASFPIWLTAEIIMSRFKDKAWTHTVYFACHLLLPLFIPFHYLFNLLWNFTKNAFTDLFHKK